jgi:hypothetical protein
MAEAVNHGLSLRMSEFDPRQVGVKFVVHQMTLARVCLQILGICTATIISPALPARVEFI